MKRQYWFALAGFLILFFAGCLCSFGSGFLVARKIYYTPSTVSKTPTKEQQEVALKSACDVIDNPKSHIGQRVYLRMKFDDTYPNIAGITLRSYHNMRTSVFDSVSLFFSGKCGKTGFTIKLKMPRSLEVPETQLQDSVLVEFYYDGKEYVADKITR